MGAVLVVLCGGYVGLSMVMSYKKEEKTFRHIISAINYMECELQYRLTPLPQLLGQAAKETGGVVREVFESLVLELDNQISPQVSYCMNAVIQKKKDVSKPSAEVFRILGQSLGRFDLEGQLKELDYVRQLCKDRLKELESGRDVRLRSYQTLGLCAGAAIAILLL
jgi:stage III sporulation protein AB